MPFVPRGRHAVTWEALRSLVNRRAAQLCAPLPAGAGCCTVCRGPAGPGYDRCYQCGRHKEAAGGMLADAVIPVCYAIRDTRHATDLWLYKSRAPGAAAARARLQALLLVFLRDHGRCAWRRAGMGAPTHLAVVPSGRGRPGRHPLEQLLSPYLALPWVTLAVRPGAEPPGRGLGAARFLVAGAVGGGGVLVVDDTWVSGASAQSAAVALKAAGARHVAVVVLGRHVNPADPRVHPFARSLEGSPFDPGTCAVHEALPTRHLNGANQDILCFRDKNKYQFTVRSARGK